MVAKLRISTETGQISSGQSQYKFRKMSIPDQLIIPYPYSTFKVLLAVQFNLASKSFQYVREMGVMGQDKGHSSL